MKQQKITLVFGEGTPPAEMYTSTWFLIYQKIIAAKQDKWQYVELPANKLGSALNSIKTYCRKHNIPVSLKVDKTRITDGIGVLWFSRVAKPPNKGLHTDSGYVPAKKAKSNRKAGSV